MGEGPPLVAVAVKVTGVLAQMTLPGLAVMLTEGTTSGVMVIVMLLLVTVTGLAQGALLVSVQVITSPLLRLLSTYMIEVPTVTLFFFHWYTGDVPPLVIVAVKVTGVPAHTGLAGLEVIVIAGVSIGFTVMVMALLVTTVGIVQLALLVSTQVTTSLLLSVFVV